jgi:hypothetical protein
MDNGSLVLIVFVTNYDYELLFYTVSESSNNYFKIGVPSKKLKN